MHRFSMNNTINSMARQSCPMPFVSVREPVLLSDEDLDYLEQLTRSRTTRKDLHERAEIVLLSHHGKSDSAIARELGITRQKVIRTINRVLAIGVREGLKDLPGRGRPKTISPEARTWIVDLLCRKPLEFGYPHEIWTQRLLQQYIREHAVEEGFPEVARISQGTISKIANASAIKPHKCAKTGSCVSREGNCGSSHLRGSKYPESSGKGG